MKRTTFLSASAAAASALAAPRFTLAAGTAATVKIGFLESFSGVFSDLGGVHKLGAQLALADANKSGRVKFEFVFGDDASNPATGTTEARRLITQEGVDVLFGGTSSAIGLRARTRSRSTPASSTCRWGRKTRSITGAKASKTDVPLRPQRAHAAAAGAAPRARAGQEVVLHPSRLRAGQGRVRADVRRAAGARAAPRSATTSSSSARRTSRRCSPSCATATPTCSCCATAASTRRTRRSNGSTSA